MIDMKPRANIGLAFDGGGVRGIIPTIALKALEESFGDKPLTENPNIKVYAGTSTGAIIATGLALGLTADKLKNYYQELAGVVFPSYFPRLYWAEKFIRQIAAIPCKSMYSGKAYHKRLREIIAEITGKENFTLGDLHQRLNPNLAPSEKPRKLIVTTMDVYNRRTKFLRSSDEQDSAWLLADAILASTAAPTYLPVFIRKVEAGQEAYVDGGIGNYNNPTYIVARELLEWGDYEPHEVSVWSFGTGYWNDESYKEAIKPQRWNILDWARTSVNLLMADAAQAQLQDIIPHLINLSDRRPDSPQKQVNDVAKQYVDNQPQPMTKDVLDFRRYQIRFNERDIDLADSRPETIKSLIEYGNRLKQQILEDKYAPYHRAEDPSISDDEKAEVDPEGVWKALQRYNASLKRNTP